MFAEVEDEDGQIREEEVGIRAAFSSQRVRVEVAADLTPEITVPTETRVRALRPIEKMLELSA